MGSQPFRHTLEYIRRETQGLKPVSKDGTSTHVIYRCVGVSNEFESPPDKNTSFIASFTNDLNHACKTNTLNANPVAVYERINKQYPFFADFKLEAEQKVEHLVTKLNSVLQKFLPNETDFGCTDTVVIATSSVDDGGFYHARFIWKEFVVTTHEALTMRDRIVGELSADEQTDQQKKTSFRWHDMVDHYCYTNVDGVTLPGCRAYRPCRSCNGKRKESTTCEECWGVGATQNEHALLPYLKIIDDGTTIKMIQLWHDDGTFLPEHVAEFSISGNTSPKVPWVRPFGTPYYHLEQKSRAAPVVYPNELVDYYNGGVSKTKNTSAIHGVSPAIAMLLRKAIQKAFRKYHSQIDVKADHITQDKKLKWYCVPVYGIGSNCCVKIDGEHQDSRVYFMVRPSGIEQCCHSKDRVSCTGGDCECRSKKCGVLPMNSNMARALFPNEKRNVANTSITASTSYQIACRSSDMAWTNMNTKKPKKSVLEYAFL